MNTNRGIFETLPSQAGDPKNSPFSIASDAGAGDAATKQSPFAMADKTSSPFSVADDAAGSNTADFGKAVKLPERKKVDSPFQVAEPSEGFGFEAPSSAAKPFESSTPAPSYPPLSSGVDTASPFSSPPQFPAPASQVFGSPTPAAAPAFQGDSGDFMSDSSSIRQLELRAIFGVDRELSADEMLQRARGLSGIRGLARVGAKEMVTIEGLKNLLPSLGLGGGPLKIYVGSTPLDFIREGSVVLAVQADGKFAPGVRETLMIVARELGRI
jgi:hypothetical protein